ncbi:MAG: Trm112 family protein [Gammaproteobacteria bacterium]
MEHVLLDMLACPACKSDLVFKSGAEVLICRAERLAFPVREGKPIMLVDEARHLSTDELTELVAGT